MGLAPNRSGQPLKTTIGVGLRTTNSAPTNSCSGAGKSARSPISISTWATMLNLQDRFGRPSNGSSRSEEHTSELQSLMRISYAVFCLKKKKNQKNKTQLRQKKK